MTEQAKTRLPNLFLVGAMKAGTTALAQAMANHPQFFLSQIKEPNRFCDLPGDDRMSEMLCPRSSTPDSVHPMGETEFVDLDSYLALFSGAGDEDYRVDASTNYLPSLSAAAHIKSAAPDAKIVMILRAPYGRAYSAWTYQHSRGRETTTTFAEAIRDELDGKRDDWAFAWQHIKTSRYADQVRRYLDLFPSDRITVILHDDLVKNSASTLADLLRFLDLPEAKPLKLPLANQTRVVTNPVARFAKYWLSYGPFRRGVRRLLPQRAKARARSLAQGTLGIVDATGERPEPLSDSACQMLAPVFEPEIDALESLLKRDLSGWRYSK